MVVWLDFMGFVVAIWLGFMVAVLVVICVTVFGGGFWWWFLTF